MFPTPAAPPPTLLFALGSSGVQTFAYIVPFGDMSDFLDHDNECDRNGLPPLPETNLSMKLHVPLEEVSIVSRGKKEKKMFENQKPKMESPKRSRLP